MLFQKNRLKVTEAFKQPRLKINTAREVSETDKGQWPVRTIK